MKKTIAVGGASLLGLSAVGLGAAPAFAADDPVTDTCDVDTEHIVTTGGLSSNWFMDCLPQYAYGEVSFDIESAEGFPAGFQSLDYVESESENIGDAAATYFGETPPLTPAGFFYLYNYDSDETSQSYLGDMVFKIASWSGITDASELPDGCDAGSYTNMYRATYEPSAVSFTQTIDGVEWRYDVTAEPEPLYFGFNTDGAGAFEPLAPICAWSENDGTNTPIYSDTFDQSAVDHAEGDSDGDLSPYFGAGKIEAARYVAPAEPEDEDETAPPAAEIANTGVDPSGTLGIAALFLAAGVAGGYLHRRRAHS